MYIYMYMYIHIDVCLYVNVYIYMKMHLYIHTYLYVTYEDKANGTIHVTFHNIRIAIYNKVGYSFAH